MTPNTTKYKLFNEMNILNNLFKFLQTQLDEKYFQLLINTNYITLSGILIL